MSNEVLLFKDYDVALKYVDALLGVEAQNQQALSLKSLVNKRMHKGA